MTIVRGNDYHGIHSLYVKRQRGLPFVENNKEGKQNKKTDVAIAIRVQSRTVNRITGR